MVLNGCILTPASHCPHPTSHIPPPAPCCQHPIACIPVPAPHPTACTPLPAPLCPHPTAHTALPGRRQVKLPKEHLHNIPHQYCAFGKKRRKKKTQTQPRRNKDRSHLVLSCSCGQHQHFLLLLYIAAGSDPAPSANEGFGLSCVSPYGFSGFPKVGKYNVPSQPKLTLGELQIQPSPLLHLYLPSAHSPSPAEQIGDVHGGKGTAGLGLHPTAACSHDGPHWLLLALVFPHASLEIPPALVFLPGLQKGLCAPTISNCTISLGTSRGLHSLRKANTCWQPCWLLHQPQITLILQKPGDGDPLQ